MVGVIIKKNDALRKHLIFINVYRPLLRAPLINAEEAAAFRKMAVQGATLKAWRVTSKSSNTEMIFS
jgi:hypothetical protein